MGPMLVSLGYDPLPIVPDDRAPNTTAAQRATANAARRERDGTELLRRTPIAVLDCNVATPLVDQIAEPPGSRRARVLVRHGTDVIGEVEVPVTQGWVRADDIGNAVDEEFRGALLQSRIRVLLGRPIPPAGWSPSDLVDAVPTLDRHPTWPTVSVVLCTKDRPDDLRQALDSLRRARGIHELIVVDNAPSNDATKRVVEAFGDVIYVVEPIQGLDRARNRGFAESTGEVVAYTDDDVEVDPGWPEVLAAAFAQDPQVVAVTGLVTPLELVTEAQEWFERLGGFGKGFERSWQHRDLTDPNDVGGRFLGAGQFGTGANMAFRRARLIELGGFDPALDVGTPTGGGGDLNMMFESLHHGGVLVYEPAAVVRHRHRRTVKELEQQRRGIGGLFAHVYGSVTHDPALRSGAAALSRWYVGYFARLLLRCAAVPGAPPLRLATAEIRACTYAWTGATYRKSVKAGRKLGDAKFNRPAPIAATDTTRVAVRHVDLAQPLSELGVAGYRSTRVFLNLRNRHVGRLEILHGGREVPLTRLRDAIAAHLAEEIGRAGHPPSLATKLFDSVSIETRVRVEQTPVVDTPPMRVSVVLPTLGRPDDLRGALQSLVQQQTRHQVEIMVVDNDPSSGEASSVVDEFDEVTVIPEPRRGLSIARNTGIRASSGSIILATDDDVRHPSDWIEGMVQHFRRDDVMAVCGNVLPLELEHPSQLAFEDMCYLGKGDVPVEVGAAWFRRSPIRPAETYDLGATANAAFRRSVFDDPAIGWFDPSLGAGTPSGAAEDSFLLFRILRAGFTVLYDPESWVSHRHRSSPQALDSQLRAYFRGAVAHQLATLQHERDLRALPQLVRLLRWKLESYARAVIRGKPEQHHRLMELIGVVQGPSAYFESRRRARDL